MLSLTSACGVGQVFTWCRVPIPVTARKDRAVSHLACWHWALPLPPGHTCLPCMRYIVTRNLSNFLLTSRRNDRWAERIKQDLNIKHINWSVSDSNKSDEELTTGRTNWYTICQANQRKTSASQPNLMKNLKVKQISQWLLMSAWVNQAVKR